MTTGAFVPREPPLPRRPGFYNPPRAGYPTNPLGPIPVTGGESVYRAPYPSTLWPTWGPATDTSWSPTGLCPEGFVFSKMERMCIPMHPGPQYAGLGGPATLYRRRPRKMATRGTIVKMPRGGGVRGYGAYLSPEIAKKWSWGSFGVGMGALAGTMALGTLAAAIQKPKGAKWTASEIIPLVLPSLGAGVIAYMLRWHVESCPCAEPAEGDVERTAEYTRPVKPAEAVVCAPGYSWNPHTKMCEPTLI